MTEKELTTKLCDFRKFSEEEKERLFENRKYKLTQILD